MKTTLGIAMIAWALASGASARAQSALRALEAHAGGAASDAAVPTPGAVAVAAPAASDEAFDAGSVVWDAMLSGMSVKRQEAMGRRVKIYTVASGQRMVDAIAIVMAQQLPAQAAAEQTADMRRSYAERIRKPVTRTPAEPRGFIWNDGARTWVFVGAESLLAAGDWDVNGSRNRRILVNNIGLAVHRSAMYDDERAELKALARAYAVPAHPYSDGDEAETFAECTEIWFGVHQQGLFKKGWDASKPFVKLAPLMRFVEKIYGPSRSVR